MSDTNISDKTIHIIGAGLAGSEAAWQAANMGARVVLHEMRPVKMTPAHKTEGCAELVCSNSFRSDDYEHNAVGLLHEEMRRLDSLIMREGGEAAVPAGGALAVDRDIFSAAVTKALEEHPNITIERGEVAGLPPAEWENVIIATGPLTSDALAKAVQELTGEDELAFFDAIAPIVDKESINMDIAWMQSRYDKPGAHGDGKDYINCPMDKEQYERFIHELLNAEYGEFKDWETDTPYFEGCMPIEVMASRGVETLRFGPMKPVGLTNPHASEGEQPYAVVQLRQDNKLGTLYNMVGFQTKMKWGEQTRVFRMIPGLEDAAFPRLGGLHRNTFINSPKLLDGQLRLKPQYSRHPVGASEASSHERDPEKDEAQSASTSLDSRSLSSASQSGGNDGQVIRFAGQITGCEGYVESAAMGLMAGRMAAAQVLGAEFTPPPQHTALGALLNHITGGADEQTFQPMNITFGLFPPLTKEEATQEYVNKKGKTKRAKLRGKDRKKAYTTRALIALEGWLAAIK